MHGELMYKSILQASASEAIAPNALLRHASVRTLTFTVLIIVTERTREHCGMRLVSVCDQWFKTSIVSLASEARVGLLNFLQGSCRAKALHWVAIYCLDTSKYDQGCISCVLMLLYFDNFMKLLTCPLIHLNYTNQLINIDGFLWLLWLLDGDITAARCVLQ